MAIFRKHYLDKEDKAELLFRQQQINQQMLIVEALEIVKKNWVISKFSKYGLDSSKNFSVNPMTGQIKEVKEKPKK